MSELQRVGRFSIQKEYADDLRAALSGRPVRYETAEDGTACPPRNPIHFGEPGYEDAEFEARCIFHPVPNPAYEKAEHANHVYHPDVFKSIA